MTRRNKVLKDLKNSLKFSDLVVCSTESGKEVQVSDDV